MIVDGNRMAREETNELSFVDVSGEKQSISEKQKQTIDQNIHVPKNKKRYANEAKTQQAKILWFCLRFLGYHIRFAN